MPRHLRDARTQLQSVYASVPSHTSFIDYGEEGYEYTTPGEVARRSGPL